MRNLVYNTCWNINRSLKIKTRLFTLLYNPQEDNSLKLKDKSLRFCIISNPRRYVCLDMSDYCKVIKIYKYAGLATNNRQLSMFIDK